MELRAGVARLDITPPIGLPMAGYASRNRPAEGLADPLSVSALVLEQGGTACGLVVADLIGLPAELTARVRSRAAELCALPPGNMLVCATHTHWGPEIRSADDGSAGAAYRALVVELAASALAEAWRRRAPALALCGAGEADLLSFNRRALRPDGQVEMNWRLPLEQARAASREGSALARTWAQGDARGERLSAPLEVLGGHCVGVTDPRVPVLKLLRPDGSPLAALFSFACHPVCGAGEEAFYLYSADYPGEARRTVETVLGCPALFLAGCCGDQVPLRRDGDARRRIGRSLGAEVLRVWEQLEGETAGPLRVAARRVSLPARESGAPVETELWSMALGREWGLVGLPGEVLVEIGLQIGHASPFGTTAVVELALDSPGYLPTDMAFTEGGYEPSTSRFGPGVEGALVSGGRAALADVAEPG